VEAFLGDGAVHIMQPARLLLDVPDSGRLLAVDELAELGVELTEVRVQKSTVFEALRVKPGFD